MEKVVNEILQHKPHVLPPIHLINGEYLIDNHYKGEEFKQSGKNIVVLLKKYLDFLKMANKQMSLFTENT